MTQQGEVLSLPLWGSALWGPFCGHSPSSVIKFNGVTPNLLCLQGLETLKTLFLIRPFALSSQVCIYHLSCKSPVSAD